MFIDLLINIVVFVLSLCTLIVIHEFGHYITAKIFNVYVTEFSIGFGPAIYSRHKEGKETKFAIRAIPLGGYCAMIGEDLGQINEEDYDQLPDDQKKLVDISKNLDPKRRLDGIAKPKRVVIMLAGITLNVVLGFLLFIGAGAAQKVIYNADNVVTVADDSTASKAGWTSTDEINYAKYKVVIHNEDGTVVDEISKETDCSKKEDDEQNTLRLYAIIADIQNYLPKTEKDYTNFEFTTAENKTIDFKLGVHYDKTYKSYLWNELGITFNMKTRHRTIGEVFKYAGSTTTESSLLIFKSLGTLFTKEGIQQVGGIVSIFQVSSEATKLGFANVLYLWGLISINLAVMNLLPIPGLDGWHVLIILIESVIRRDLPKSFKEKAANIGMLLLFGLMILITFKDVLSLF